MSLAMASLAGLMSSIADTSLGPHPSADSSLRVNKEGGAPRTVRSSPATYHSQPGATQPGAPVAILLFGTRHRMKPALVGQVQRARGPVALGRPPIVSPGVAGLACPASSETRARSPVMSSRSEMDVRRRSWRLKARSPAWAARRWQASQMVLGSRRRSRLGLRLRSRPGLRLRSRPGGADRRPP